MRDTEPPAEPPTLPPVIRAAKPAPRAPLTASRRIGAALELGRASIEEAVYLEARELGLDELEALAFVEDVADRLRLDGCDPPDPAPEIGFYDLRSEQDYRYPNGKRKTRIRAGAPVVRDPSDVTTIVVHQTAVEYGVSKRAIANADGDIALARARRALDVACHAMAFRQGYYVASHPLRVYVNHGNRFNSYSLGLEIDGRYPGLEDDPATAAREDLKTTWGGNPTELTDTTVEAARAALRFLVEEGRREGMPIEYVVSHRQSNDNRRSDPGAEIWRRVVLDYAVAELGLTAKRDSRWREGRPVPVQWDPDGIGNY